MSQQTPRYSLPYVIAAQAQKHVTHNESLKILDGMTNLNLQGIDATTPPLSPQEGETFALGQNAIDDWAGHDDELAAFIDGTWMFYVPFDGLRAYDFSTSSLLVWHQSAWKNISTSENGEFSKLAVNTSFDANNKVSVKAPTVLFSHDDNSQNPTGDIRVVINKKSATDNAALALQSDFQDRAVLECGTDDKLAVRVSKDGINYNDAVVVTPEEGKVGLGGTPTDKLTVYDTLDNGVSRIRALLVLIGSI